MATVRKVSDVPRAATVASYVGAFLIGCWITFQERRKRARLRAVLHGLSERDLKDVGIARSEIDYLSLNGTDLRTDPRGHLRNNPSDH